jgi:tetratricopeptide (TPR) repeat protein
MERRNKMKFKKGDRIKVVLDEQPLSVYSKQNKTGEIVEVNKGKTPYTIQFDGESLLSYNWAGKQLEKEVVELQKEVRKDVKIDYYGMGLKYLKECNYKSAKFCFERGLENSTPGINKRTFEYLLGKVKYVEGKDYQKALDFFVKATIDGDKVVDDNLTYHARRYGKMCLKIMKESEDKFDKLKDAVYNNKLIFPTAEEVVEELKKSFDFDKLDENREELFTPLQNKKTPFEIFTQGIKELNDGHYLEAKKLLGEARDLERDAEIKNYYRFYNGIACFGIYKNQVGKYWRQFKDTAIQSFEYCLKIGFPVRENKELDYTIGTRNCLNLLKGNLTSISIQIIKQSELDYIKNRIDIIELTKTMKEGVKQFSNVKFIPKEEHRLMSRVNDAPRVQQFNKLLNKIDEYRTNKQWRRAFKSCDEAKKLVTNSIEYMKLYYEKGLLLSNLASFSKSEDKREASRKGAITCFNRVINTPHNIGDVDSDLCRKMSIARICIDELNKKEKSQLDIIRENLYNLGKELSKKTFKLKFQSGRTIEIDENDICWNFPGIAFMNYEIDGKNIGWVLNSEKDFIGGYDDKGNHLLLMLKKGCAKKYLKY